MSQKILITGANGAFGSLIVRQLITAGHSVAASMRDIVGRNRTSADALTALGAHVVEIDVTDDASVNTGVAAAITVLGGLDVLVNNAGTGAHGLLEAFESSQLSRLFEVNVIGLHRVTRAVLPGFRDQGAGLVLNFSSLLGRLSLPFYGSYSATKFAVETLSETYKAELSGFGVDVAVIEPGGFPTTFIENTMHPADVGRLAQYGDFADVPAQSKAGFEARMKTNPDQDPKKVAEAVLSVIDTPAGQRDFRTIVDFMGMGGSVGKLNQTLDQVHDGVFTAFGIAGMRSLKLG